VTNVIEFFVLATRISLKFVADETSEFRPAKTARLFAHYIVVRSDVFFLIRVRSINENFIAEKNYLMYLEFQVGNSRKKCSSLLSIILLILSLSNFKIWFDA